MVIKLDVSPDDPFEDLDSLRLGQDFTGTGAEKLLNRIPVRKPHRQEFIRVRPGEGHRLDTAMVELKEDREWYIVSPSARPLVLEELRPVRLMTAITRQGVVFLWPAILPGPDGRVNAWHASALEAAELAESSWIRMAANRSLGAYEIYRALGELPPPTWPDKSLGELMAIAFKNGTLVTREDHPLVQRLTGRS